MESLVTWFATTLGPYISEKAVVFLISMMPLLELRGGLLASSLLKVSAVQAIPICIIGNILPIPFILLFIKKIFQWMKKIKCFRGLIEKLENRAMGRSEKIQQYEFWGLVLFVGIPLPGTGAWTDFQNQQMRDYLKSDQNYLILVCLYPNRFHHICILHTPLCNHSHMPTF